MKCISDIKYGPYDSNLLDIFLPEEKKQFPVMIYFHGGGIEAGCKTDNNSLPMITHLVNSGVCVISCDYRLYPDAKYPEFIEDAAAAVAYVKEHISEYGSCKDIFVGGSSAGGYISQMLCFDGRYLGKYGISPTDISGYVHDAGQPTCHFNVLREMGIDTRRVIVNERAPLYYVGIAETYAPMCIIVSDNDITNRYEQTMLLVSTLRQFCPTVDITLHEMHGNHCAYTFPPPENEESVFGKIILDFIQAKVGKNN